jgi:LPS export ABC transporter protein LptC
MKTTASPIILLAIACASCGESGEAPLVAEEILQLNSRANRVAMGLEHYVASEGIRRARIYADTAFFIEDVATVELRQMEVVFYDDFGYETTVLTAREGTYDWDSGDMTAAHDVVIIKRQEDERIESEEMFYDRAGDRIWSDTHTTMYKADGTVIEGTSFVSDSGMEDVALTEPRILRRSTDNPPE